SGGAQTATRPGQTPATRPGQPGGNSQVATRPGQPGASPATRPGQPSATRPGQPGANAANSGRPGGPGGNQPGGGRSANAYSGKSGSGAFAANRPAPTRTATNSRGDRVAYNGNHVSGVTTKGGNEGIVNSRGRVTSIRTSNGAVIQRGPHGERTIV